MNMLLMRAYPRKNGYTNKLTELFVQGIKESGVTLVDKDITLLKIHPCIGCYKCWVTAPGVCCFKDDMVALKDDILKADIIVCATPLNSFSVTSSLKAVFDRTLSLTKPEFEETSLGTVRNTLRYPEHWPKKFAYIVVGAFNGQEIFTGIKGMMTHYANALSMETAGSLLRPESFLLPFALAKPMTIKTIEAGFVRAGYELASEGRISAESKEKAETPLSSDLPYFKKYANIYWEYAVALGDKSSDIDLLCKKVSSDVRILMAEMARSYDPVSTAKLKANFQFEFPDKNLFFTLVIDHGKCSYFTEKNGKPDLLLTTTSNVWGKVFTREINVRDALVTRQITLAGDKSLFSRLDRYFPPPAV